MASNIPLTTHKNPRTIRRIAAPPNLLVRCWMLDVRCYFFGREAERKIQRRRTCDITSANSQPFRVALSHGKATSEQVKDATSALLRRNTEDRSRAHRPPTQK